MFGTRAFVIQVCLLLCLRNLSGFHGMKLLTNYRYIEFQYDLLHQTRLPTLVALKKKLLCKILVTPTVLFWLFLLFRFVNKQLNVSKLVDMKLTKVICSIFVSLLMAPKENSTQK